MACLKRTTRWVGITGQIRETKNRTSRKHKTLNLLKFRVFWPDEKLQERASNIGQKLELESDKSDQTAWCQLLKRSGHDSGDGSWEHHRRREDFH